MTSTPNPQQTLGQHLRQERESRGITIEQVASATKIGVRSLHAMEADQYADLPAKPFVRGFVISYCRFIGVDHKDVLTRFAEYLEEKVQQERPNREAGHSGYAFEKRDGEQQSRTVLAVLLGVFVAIGGVAAFLKPHHHHHESPVEKLRAVHAQVSPAAPSSTVAETGPAAVTLASVPTASPAATVQAEPTAVAPSTVGSSAPSPAAAARAEAAPSPSAREATRAIAGSLPEPSASGEPGDPLNSGKLLKADEIQHRLVVKGEDAVWVRYRVDARPIMQFPLKKDKTLVLRARQVLVLQASHPEDVKISYNNEGYHPMQEDKGLVARRDDATLFYPHQLADKVQEPFPGSEPLATRPIPLSRTGKALSTANP